MEEIGVREEIIIVLRMILNLIFDVGTPFYSLFLETSIMKNITLVCIGFLLLQITQADQRHFVWTYESKLVQPGEVELETYYTTSALDENDWENTSSTEQQFEFEIGMNEKFDFAIYQTFQTDPGQPVKYKGFKLRWRYQLKDVFFPSLSPVAYVEYKGTPGFSNHELETKLIFSHSTGNLSFSVNPQIEWEYEDTWESKWKFTSGVNYQYRKLMGVGLEFFADENSQFAGPVISHGKGDKWVALGSAFQLHSTSNTAPKIQIRLIMGFGL